jgi:hypothetical protein
MKTSRYVLYAGAIAAVVVAALIASLQLRGSNPVAVTPSPSASGSPAPTTTTTASPTPSAAATPIGFVLPPDCSYVSGPLPVLPAGATPSTYWEFTCAGAATPDLMAVERIAPAFARQGWTPCPSNPGTGVWWKGAIQTMVGQGSPYPGLSQLARQSQDCPGGPTAGSTGAVTGRFGYGSDFIPPVTVYAISTTDQRVWYSMDFAGVGNPPRPTLPPGVSQPTYTITGIAPGNYWVVAYRNDGQLPDPGYYSRAAACMRIPNSGGCPDGTLIPATVTAGQMTSDVDVVVWGPPPGQPSPTLPPRPTPR